MRVSDRIARQCGSERGARERLARDRPTAVVPVRSGRRWRAGVRCRRASLVLAACISLASAHNVQAGAWTSARGDGVVIVTSAFSGAAKGFDADGRLQPLPEYRKFELSAYLEYGLTDWLTGVVHSSARMETQNSSLTTTAVDGLGLRARLVKRDRIVASIELTGYSPGLDRTGLWVESEPAAAEARALIGYAFDVRDRPAFVDAQAAYRLSAGGEDDEIHIDVTLGMKPTPRWLLLAQAFTTLSVGKAADYRYHKFQASAVCWLTPRHGLQAGVGGTLDGVSALQERTVFAGFWYRF